MQEQPMTLDLMPTPDRTSADVLHRDRIALAREDRPAGYDPDSATSVGRYIGSLVAAYARELFLRTFWKAPTADPDAYNGMLRRLTVAAEYAWGTAYRHGVVSTLKRVAYVDASLAFAADDLRLAR